MTTQLDFKASIELGIDREATNRFVRVTQPNARSPMTASVKVLGMNADVIFGSNGIEKPNWDQAKADELQAVLLAKLHEVIDASELMTSNPSVVTPGSAAYRRISQQIAAKVLAHGNEYQATEIFESVVVSAAPTLIKATAVAAAVAREVNPTVIPPVIVPETPVDPEEPALEEGATVVAYGIPISSQFLTNGNLFSGSGIPGNKYNVTRNDILELAIMSHRRAQWDQGRQLDGTENVSLTLTGPTDRWNISWSVGSLTEEMQDITEHYDVALILGLNSDGSLNEGEYIQFNLTKDPEAPGTYSPYTLVESTGQIHTTIDSKGDPLAMSVQNSTSHHWFKPALIPPVADAAAVEGTYTVLLRAVHKTSGNVLEARTVTTAMV